MAAVAASSNPVIDGGKRNRRNRGGGGGGGTRGAERKAARCATSSPGRQEFDVIPAAELETTKNGMNLAELKTRPWAAALCSSLSRWAPRNWPGPASKTSLPSSILKCSTRRTAKTSSARARSRSLQDGFGFLRSAGRLVPRGPRRHLRQPEPDPPLQPAHGRHRLRPDPHAEGRRALLRAAEGRRDQPRRARERADKVLFENLTPLFPKKRLKLERGNGTHRGSHRRASSTWSRRSAKASAA